MNIPNIIIQQLLTTNSSTVGLWGAHGWAATSYNTLSFKVDGHHFKGIISIIFDEALDLYEIHYFDNNTISSLLKNPKQSKKFSSMTGIYCDQLVGLIDENIELIDAYYR